MPAIIVVGIQWGDEGKGKIVDVISQQSDVVVRHQGGNNAGHTVWVNEDKYVLHLLPMGLLRGKPCAIGSGVVVDPKVLLGEIEGLQSRGISISPDNLWISPNCHVIFNYHVLIDTLREKRRGKSAIGTTSRGIGPAYRDKIDRAGIRLGDLADPERLEKRLRPHMEYINDLLVEFYKEEALDYDTIYAEYVEYGKKIAPYLSDVPAQLARLNGEGKNILFEGAQGALLDIDAGTFPFVTSSNTGSGGACTGSGFPPHKISDCLGIVKAYTTRVGAGPFPTELDEVEADRIRNVGPAGEFGATTGRPRRCGWFDGPLVKRAVTINGAGLLAITRMDILSEFDEIPMGTKYILDGEETDIAPEDLSLLDRCEVVYEKFPGWKVDISGVRKWEDLPENAQLYLRKIEEITGSKVVMVSVGPDRDETIFVEESLFDAVG